MGLRDTALWFAHEKILLKLACMVLSAGKGKRGLALIIQERGGRNTRHSIGEK
jgi:hypothetical protein